MTKVKLYDLTQRLSIHTPPWPSYMPLQVQYFKRLAGAHMGQGANGQIIKTSNHVGTHIDGEIHFCANGRTIGEVPLEEWCGDGVVVEKGYSKSAGNYVKVKHNSVYTTGYNHFSKFASGIQVGTKVKQGQVIGYVGKTGYATGPHLDYRVWMNGHLINPLKIKAPPIEPIKEQNIQDFQAVVVSLNSSLKAII